MRDDDVTVLGDLLEQSFGSGPGALPHPAERLADGRRALRRRQRLAVAATSVGVIAAVGAGVTVSGLGGERGADAQLPPAATSGASTAPSPKADDTAGSPAQQRHQTHAQEQRLVSGQFPASYGSDGQIVVKDGWHITQQVDEPLALHPPESSMGVVVTDGQQVRWLLVAREHAVDGNGNADESAFSVTASADDPGKGYSRFDDWLASQVALNRDPGAGQPSTTEPAQSLVVVDDTGRLQAAPGAELVDTRPAPVIEGYTSKGDQLAEVRRDGRTWFVVFRQGSPNGGVVPVDAAVLPEPTIEGLVSYLKAQLASGEGVR